MPVTSLPSPAGGATCGVLCSGCQSCTVGAYVRGHRRTRTPSETAAWSPAGCIVFGGRFDEVRGPMDDERYEFSRPSYRLEAQADGAVLPVLLLRIRRAR